MLLINGFSYSVTVTRGINYVYCSNLECRARGRVNENRDPESLQLSENHNHLEDWRESRKNDFLLQLKKECQRTASNLRQVYDKLSLQFTDVSVDIPYSKIKRQMTNWKLISYPKIPDTYNELSVSLRENK